MSRTPGAFADARGYPEHFHWTAVGESLGSLLQDEREAKVLDIIDKIKEHDLDRELDLPMLVVCGKQSSGKSSVLEAITRISFPKGENTCTRFVTEVQLKNAEQQSIEGIIRPHGGRSPDDQARLRRYRSRGGPDKMNEIIDAASHEMGIDANTAQRKFSQDVLQLTIRGPNVLRLTLVDVPGLILHNTGQADEVALVEEITDSYIGKKNAIILAVVNADADLTDHRIIEKVKLVDPLSERTFGIITKPDRPEAGHSLEKSWVRIVQNSSGDAPFKKGAHVLLNRTEHQHVTLQLSLADRDKNEEEFFQNHTHRGQNNTNSGRPNGWHVLYSTDKWGINKLRSRLKTILFNHTRDQIPRLEEDIERRLAVYTSEVNKFGPKDPEAVKGLLRKRLAGMSSIADHGSKGTYRHEFFVIEKHARWLRSRIRDESENFTQKMTESGHNTDYAWSPDTLPTDETPWVNKICDFLHRTRGTELDGYVDASRIEVLFRSYSGPWHSIAQDFIKQAYDHCWNFVREVVEEYTKDGLVLMSGRFRTHILRKRLEERKDSAYSELSDIEKDHRGPLMTENVQFWYKSLGKQRDREWSKENAKLATADQHSVEGSIGSSTAQNTPSLSFGMNGLHDKDTIRKEDAIRLINDMIIYYKLARDRFIDMVIIQAAQRRLLQDFEALFESSWMDDVKVFERITRDPDIDEQMKTIDEKKKRKANLEACLTTLREII